MTRALLALAPLFGCSPPDASAPDTGTPSATTGTGTGTGTGTAPGSPPSATTEAWRDDFDSALGPEWQVYDPHTAVQVSVSGGELDLELTARSLWFDDNDGFALYRLVSGDFAWTTRVRVFRTSNPTSAPTGFVELAGLMIRDPAGEGAGAENYVFAVLGSDDGLDTAGTPELAIEAKSTVNSSSDYVNPSWPVAEAELRICRQGDQITLFHRLSGAATWEPTPTALAPEAFGYTRTLPDTLQAGVVLYSALDQPDVSARFDFVSWSPLDAATGCLDGA